MISTESGKAPDLSDERNTVFYTLMHGSDVLGESYVIYYARISGWTPQYCMTVNGKPAEWHAS